MRVIAYHLFGRSFTERTQRENAIWPRLLIEFDAAMVSFHTSGDWLHKQSMGERRTDGGGAKLYRQDNYAFKRV